MKKALYGLLLTGGLLFAGTGTAYAGDCVSFSALDRNQDGAISKQEATAIPRLSARWDILDSNSDGRIDEAEFARYRGPERFPAGSGRDTGWGESWQSNGEWAMVLGGSIAAAGLVTPIIPEGEAAGGALFLAGAATWVIGQVGSELHCE